MKRWPVFGVVLAVIWLFVRGVELVPHRLLQEFLIGLGIGVPLAFLLRRFYGERVNATGAVGATPAAVAYLVTFLWELLTANVDVAYRVLHPRQPIRPAVVEIPLRVQSDLAITSIANSITLTPGTLTMDYDEDRNSLYVHAMVCDERDDVVPPIRRWEDYALRIFDEPVEPGDAPPATATIGRDDESVDGFGDGDWSEAEETEDLATDDEGGDSDGR